MPKISKREKREQDVIALFLTEIKSDLPKWREILLAKLREDTEENGIEDWRENTFDIFEDGFKSVWKWTAQEIAVNLVIGCVDTEEFMTAQAEFESLKELYESYVD